MKAIITIIDDDGKVLEKERMIYPTNEFIDGTEGNDISICKHAVFEFHIRRLLDEEDRKGGKE